MVKKGMFIVFDGLDGCGKSTQIKKFALHLFELNKYNHIILTRNPYKNTDIRAILRGENDPISKAELLAELFINDRKHHAEEIIIPSIEKGHFVVSDRYKLSTIAYQAAQGMNMQFLVNRHEGLPVPDITFIIDLPSTLCGERMSNDEEERSEKHKFEKNLDFLEKVRENYIMASELLPQEKIYIINGNRDIDTIFSEIVGIFEKHLESSG